MKEKKYTDGLYDNEWHDFARRKRTKKSRRTKRINKCEPLTHKSKRTYQFTINFVVVVVVLHSYGGRGLLLSLVTLSCECLLLFVRISIAFFYCNQNARLWEAKTWSRRIRRREPFARSPHTYTYTSQSIWLHLIKLHQRDRRRRRRRAKC